MTDGEARRNMDSETLIREYGEAFARRDLDACADFYGENATIKFLFATYEGRDAIRQWHADRFDADAEIVGMNTVRADGDTVSVEAEVTSRRLKFFRINKVKGSATFRIKQNRIVEATFAARSGSSSHLDWQFD